MKILVVSQYYYPEQFRVNDICEDLVKKGHEVTVLTGLPNYPQGEIYKGYEFKAGTTERINGVIVHRCKLYPRKQGVKNLALNYLSFVVQGSKEINRLNDEYDVVFVYQMSPITMAIPAVKYCKKRKKTLVLYCLDLWPASILDQGFKRNGLIYNIVKLLSKSIYSKCDKLIVSSPSFIGYISKLCNSDSKKFSYIPQHAEEIYRPNYSLFDGCLNTKECNFVYLGNIGYSQNCECIVEAARILSFEEKFKIHFVGTGSKIEELKALVNKYNLEEKIIFHGFVKLDQINKFYDLAEACLLTLASDSEIGLTIPAKLQSYMAAGKTIVAAISGDANKIINESKCGYCVEAGDYLGLANSMKKVIHNRTNAYFMGKSGRDYFEKNFARSIVLERIEKELLIYGDSLLLNE